MKMFIRGAWKDTAESIEVKNPYDQSVVDTVPRADAGDVDEALDGAVEGAEVMRKMPAYDRAQVLFKTAELMRQRAEDFARIISSEEGKILAEGHFEATRAAEIIQLSAEEAKRLTGEVLPLDAAPGAGYLPLHEYAPSWHAGRETGITPRLTLPDEPPRPETGGARHSS